MSIVAEAQYFQQVCSVLELEAEMLHKAVKRLSPEEVDKAIQILADCKGKVILTGVGKSGVIASKIASTLNSTGTVALYLHASDALHGDLGSIRSEDAMIIISNSGETEEILAMLPHIRKRGVPIIAIVGNLTSTLARNANAVLDSSVDREACPLNLAPTASTTLSLAIGDALAVTLMQVKNISVLDFAQNHPAGRLGKRLTLRVKDLMKKGAENPVVYPEATWVEIIEEISRCGVGAVSVVDIDGTLLGIITDGDIRRTIQRMSIAELLTIDARKIMTASPVTTTPNTLAYDALKAMENRQSQISVLPVIDENRKCIGIIRLHDIIRSGL